MPNCLVTICGINFDVIQEKINMRTIRLFAESTSSDFFKNKADAIKKQINSATKAQLSDEGYKSSIIRTNKLTLPTLDTDNLEKEMIEKEVSISLYPPTFDFGGRSHTNAKAVLYKIPYKGDLTLLELRPSRFSSGGVGVAEVDDSGKRIVFEFINIDNNPENIRNQYNTTLGKFSSHYTQLESEIKQWNQDLDALVTNEINKRNEGLNRDNDFLDKL